MSIGDLLREMFADCTGEQGFVAGCLFSLGFVFEWVLLSKLFDLACDFLDSVQRSSKSSETLLFAFILKSFKFLGVAPELSCCTCCGKRAEDFGNPGVAADARFRMFSVSSGGIICPDCVEQEKTEANSLIYRPSFDIIDVFKYFDSRPLSTFEKVKLRPEVSRQIREILSEYCSHYLGADVLSEAMRLEV